MRPAKVYAVRGIGLKGATGLFSIFSAEDQSS